MQLCKHSTIQYQRYSWYVALFVFKAGTIAAVNALSCQTPNIPVKQPPSSPSSWWPVNCWSVAWHRQGKLIPGESSRSEAVSTKAKYTAMHQNELGRGRLREAGFRCREEEREWKREGERRVKMSVILCMSERRYAQEGARKRKHNGEEWKQLRACVCRVRSWACPRERKLKYIYKETKQRQMWCW